MRNLLLVTILLVSGCRTVDDVVPYDAPLMLSRDEVIRDPYVRSHKQWVQAKGTVTRHKGDIVTSPASTQPAK